MKVYTLLKGFDDTKPLTLIEVDCHRLVGDVKKMGSFSAHKRDWDVIIPRWVQYGEWNPTIYKPESREGYYPLGHYASWDVEKPNTDTDYWWHNRHWQCDRKGSISNEKCVSFLQAYFHFF